MTETLSQDQIDRIMLKVRKSIYCEKCGTRPRMYWKGALRKLCGCCAVKALLYLVYNWRNRIPTDISIYRQERYLRKRWWKLGR